MNANTTYFGKVGNKVGTSIATFLFAVLVWFLHRYNQTNKVLNIWERSSKDIATHGVDSQVRACISRDNRLHIRWQKWSIYIGQPHSLKPVK